MENLLPLSVYICDASPLSDPDLYRACYDALTTERREKADRLRFSKDRILSVAAGYLLRSALIEAGVDPLCKIGIRQNGKPYLADDPAIRFNLSHAGNYVMCAISRYEVGCDVQDAVRHFDSIAERFFTDHEKRFLASSSDADAAFALLWTRKESLAKACGKGIAQLYDNISTADGRGLLSRVAAGGLPYRFVPLPSFDIYACSCCIQNDTPVRMKGRFSCDDAILPYLRFDFE